MPTSVSRLLEEAVSFLDTSNASKQGDVKESLESVLGKLKEVAAQRETGAEGERISELRQLLEQVGGNIRDQGARVQGLEEKQNMLVMEVKGLGDDIKRNFERMEKFCQEESQSRQKWQQKYELSAQNRMEGGGSVLRRLSRPSLIPTGAGSEQGAVSGRIGGKQQTNLPRTGVVANAYIPPALSSIRGGQTCRTSAPPKVARVFPRGTVLAGFPSTAANVCRTQPRANHSMLQQQTQCAKRKSFDVFELDSDSDSD